jgi:sugar O-acyltransferase (sialic acid O-acetyltransferase NeuD family)
MPPPARSPGASREEFDGDRSRSRVQHRSEATAMSGLLILGAGGHGRVVLFTARSTGLWTEIAFLDDRCPDVASVDGSPVLGNFDAAAALIPRFGAAVVALGAAATRLRVLDRLRDLGFELPTMVHPSAVVSGQASLGAGTVVFAQAVIHPGTTLDEGCIVNTAASVDHDCHLGRGVHVAPGAHLGGDVTVGDLTWLGLGAAVKNGVHIGARVMVGCGAAVVGDLPDGVTAMGVPARVTTRTERL